MVSSGAPSAGLEARLYGRQDACRYGQIVLVNHFTWYCDKVEALLDAGHGACWMNRPDVGDLVAGAVKFFAGQRYDLRAWVVMPNHVHAVLWPHPGHTLSEILHSWKSYTSNQVTNSSTIRVRILADRIFDLGFAMMLNASDVAYVENNPAKARLCNGPGEWIWAVPVRA